MNRRRVSSETDKRHQLENRPTDKERGELDLNTQGLMNKWNRGVHRKRAGKRQKQEFSTISTK